MNRLILLVLIIAPLFGMTQVPGYNGKRFVAKAHFSFAPIYTFWSNSTSGYQANFNAGIQLEYTLSRSSGIILNLAYKPTALVPEEEDPGKVSAKYIGIQYRAFSFAKNGSIAPYGRYGLVEAGYLFGNVNIDEPIKNLSNETSSSISTLYIGLGTGKQAIIADYLVLDFGVTVGYVLGWERQLDGPDNLEEFALRNLAGGQAARFYLNIGGLLF